MTHLPHPLASAPFRVGTALDAGVTPSRLRNRDLDSSVWGIRAAKTSEGLRDRCALVMTRMPEDAVLSHSTAALLWGIPLAPGHVERDLHVSVPTGHRAPHAAGIRGHQLLLPEHDIVMIDGMRVTTPERTWCDLASILRLHDLVAAGDRVISLAHPLCSLQTLVAHVESRPGRRGFRRLLRALPLLDGASESPPESVLRVILVLAGLPLPKINHTLVDTETGHRTRPDFLFERHRVILEYQGDYHRSREQWRRDMTRRSRLEAQGWTVVELNADDLVDPTELIARLRTILARHAR